MLPIMQAVSPFGSINTLRWKYLYNFWGHSNSSAGQVSFLSFGRLLRPLKIVALFSANCYTIYGGGYMKSITEIDSNFKVETQITQQGIRFYNALHAPFQIHGVYHENGKFRRIPEEIAKNTNEGVLVLHANTAGGRVRFVTDSPYVAIHTKMPQVGKMPHFAFTGSAGFDLYEGETYLKSFMPPLGVEDGYESIQWLDGGKKLRELTLHLPLYSDVGELYIGLDEKAQLLPASAYRVQLPIVYYGSSITQGGCASRPGNCYTNILSRKLNADHWNLGFSGSARGEESIVNYIKGLPMSVFVLDYDHNAPTVEHLQATHGAMFRAIRKAQPELPILILSRPKFYRVEEEDSRLEVIRETYRQAKEAGDENVYLIEGTALMALAGNDGTVDDCHPNDLGFASMAKAILPILQSIL